MTTESLTLVPRETRTKDANKRRHRYVDQKIQRQEKLAFKAKRHVDLDNEDDNYDYCS